MHGYKAEDITILTTYNGQIFQFAQVSRLSCNFESAIRTKAYSLRHILLLSVHLQDRKKYPYLRKVRITAVDNFQGEDNKIILLSLVRSNTENNIGYLAFKNRICVALSRARHGFYIIGNMTTLSKASNIWKDIQQELMKQNAIGSELDLVCYTHKTVHKVRFCLGHSTTPTLPPYSPTNRVCFVYL